ncbi:MAG: hypothetical protein HYY06_21535 [Deltaproteobacteria bacterium]|nr:hypothetical protein [Deltaproteobacteria bacterium]
MVTSLTRQRRRGPVANALTAAPEYDAERTLYRFFPDLVHEMTLEEALALDLLAPVSVWVVEVDGDASSVRILAGDYLEHELVALVLAAPFFEAARPVDQPRPRPRPGGIPASFVVTYPE